MANRGRVTMNRQVKDAVNMLRYVRSLRYVQERTFSEMKIEGEIKGELDITCTSVPKLQILFFHIPNTGEDVEAMLKGLLFAAAQDFKNYLQAFIVYVNIMRIVFDTLEKEIKEALVNSGMEIINTSSKEMLEWLQVLTRNGIGGEAYNKIDPNYRVLIGICFNLITKRLTSLNYRQEMTRWRAAYSRACLAHEKDESLIAMTPSLSFCFKVNSSFASCFKLKTLIFNAVRTTSNEKTNPMSLCAKTTMVYYNMAE